MISNRMIFNRVNIELIVPEGATMTYTLDPDVQRIVCRVGAYAQLTLLHASQQAIPALHQTYVLQQASRLVLRGWYEHAIDMHLEVVLQGASAQADVKIGFKGDNVAIAHFTTVQRHEAPHTTSSLLYKSLLADRAQTVHTGMIHIASQATDANAKLYSNHMLKGARAYAHVQPNLEVLINEVQCAHGSAIGMFDEDMLFYLQAHGIDATSAGRLLEEAFFAEVRL